MNTLNKLEEQLDDIIFNRRLIDYDITLNKREGAKYFFTIEIEYNVNSIDEEWIDDGTTIEQIEITIKDEAEILARQQLGKLLYNYL